MPRTLARAEYHALNAMVNVEIVARKATLGELPNMLQSLKFNPTLASVGIALSMAIPVRAEPQAADPADPGEPRAPASLPTPTQTELPATELEPVPPETEPSPAQLEPAPEPAETQPEGPSPVRPAAPTAPAENEVFEPPLPGPALDLEPPPPPTPNHRSPRTSLVVGARGGWLFPAGSLWRDGYVQDRYCCRYQDRNWSDFASSGPAIELDVGARLARSYTVFGFWELGSLGTGEALGDEFGGQDRGLSHHLGGGLRFSTDPNDLGMLIEVGLGYRRFEAGWESGTELLAQDAFSTRIGLGMSIRLNRNVVLSPMALLGGGSFNRIEWTFADGTKRGAFAELSSSGQYTTASLQMGAHFDLLGSKD